MNEIYGRLNSLKDPHNVVNLRGAKIFGKPICSKLDSFSEDVSDEYIQRRLISMFFGESVDKPDDFGDIL